MWTPLLLALLGGCGHGNALEVSRLIAPSQAEKDDCELGSGCQLDVYVRNIGTTATRYDASVDAALSLNDDDGGIASGGIQKLTITHEVSSFEDHSGTLTVEGDHNIIQIQLLFHISTDSDHDGYEAVEAGGDDCDDQSADVHPGAVEICDEVDQDCDELVDEDAEDVTSWYLDQDDDGWGGWDDTVVQCDQPTGHVPSAGDCDDHDPDVHPHAVDPCNDGVDQDCDEWDDYDCDRDTYEAQSYGGEDCNDDDAAINPEATEIWYDGIDQDCDGGSDYDRDRDTWLSPLGDGKDCDDLDASIHPLATESDDGVDQDCDGRIDEDFILDGDLLITEIMVDPSALSVDKGQYVELTNLSERDIYLDGLEVRSDAGTSILGASLLLPDESALVCAEVDSAQNGGMSCAGSLAGLLGSEDLVRLKLEDPLDRLDWTGWDIPEGASLELELQESMTSEDNDDSTPWCESSVLMSTGDLGSPGDASAHCQ